MTPRDEQMILQARCFKAESPPAIHLLPASGDIGDKMAAFCDRIRALAPAWKITKDSELPFPAPSLVIGRHRNIAYQVEPTGKFLTYLLQGLEDACGNTPLGDSEIGRSLKRIDLPAALKLYVAVQCPNCPRSIEQLQALAAQNAQIRLSIIDARIFAQAAQMDQVRSVPTLILDDRLRWTGPVKTEELLAQCIQRNPAQLSAASLRQLIEAGDAARVSEMMVTAGQPFPSFLELLVHERWSVRLGAMVTAEYLAEGAPELHFQFCQMLWERFKGLSSQVQGDVIQVLGQVDSDSTRNNLQSILSGAYAEEVKTAAAEVLEEMGP